MGNFILYPAIDLRGGKVVRLSQGKRDQQTEYSNSPVEVAEKWISQGTKWIHVVNLDGAFGEAADYTLAAVENIIAAGKKKTKIQFGGGLRSVSQIANALNMGISRVVLGTAVIEDPAFGEAVLDQFGGERIALGFDALDQELMSRGWQSASGVKIFTLAERFAKAGAKTLIYTNIRKDGMQTGVDWKNAKLLFEQTGLEIIASGGTAELKDIQAVRNAGLSGVIIGRALYEGNFTLKDALNVR